MSKHQEKEHVVTGRILSTPLGDEKKLITGPTNSIGMEIKHRAEHLSNQILKEGSLPHRNVVGFDELKKQYQLLPRLSKKQYEQLPKEQREQYIKMLETITSKLSANILFSAGSAIKKNPDEELTDLMKQFNHLDKDFSFITLQAMQIAIEKRKKEEKQKIDHQRLELTLKKPIGLIMKRVSFKMKCLKLQQDNFTLEKEKRRFKDSCSQFKILPFLCDSLTDYVWISLLIVMYYYDKDWYDFISNGIQTVKTNGSINKLQQDTNNLFTTLKNYKIEECLLFLVSNGNEIEYESIKRFEFCKDSSMETLRQKKLEQERKISTYNKTLTEQWNTLSDLDKLKYYLKEESRKDYEEILKKSKLLGLDENGIIDLFIDFYRKENELFIQRFNPSTFKEEIPLMFPDESLAVGFHLKSLEIATHFNVPETIVTCLYDHGIDIEKTLALLLDITVFKNIFLSELKIPEESDLFSPQPKL